jgi:NAD(P)H-hydrate epimerase
MYKIPVFFARELTGHKGTFGVVLGVGGSRGMAGSVSLAGRASLLVGAGLVRLAVPSPVLETVAGFYPEPTTIPLPADSNGKISINAKNQLLQQAQNSTSIFIGTGLGRSENLNKLVPEFLRELDKQIETGLPKGIVVDADALNALAGQVPVFNRANVIFTPHSGEFGRLIQDDIPNEQNQINRINIAKNFASKHNVVVVLKGHETIITNGKDVAVNNQSGNPGMATGGSGDVLTGMLAGLVARGFGVFDAAVLGVYLHGLAGDIAAEKYGEESVIASYILESIPNAIKKLNQ